MQFGVLGSGGPTTGASASVAGTECPVARKALEGVRPRRRETEALSRPPDAREFLTDHLAFADVEAAAHVEPELLHAAFDRHRAADPARRPVETCEDAIACRIEFAAPKALNSRRAMS